MRTARLPLRFTLLLASIVFAAAVGAAEPRPPADVPPPPPPAENEVTPRPPADAIEPEITITSKGTEIHEEYRVNGRLYRVKVIPRHGAPYFLNYDEHGDFHRSDAEPKVLVPQWVIKRF